MWHRALVRVVFCASLGVLVSAPAIAEPIRITGGEFTATDYRSSFTFSGDGLFLAAAGGEGFAVSMLSRCGPCVGAPPIALSFNSIAPGAGFSGGGPGTFEGIEYARTFLSGSFFFSGPSFSSADLSPSNLTITAPFSMTATLQNYASNPLTSTDPPLFTASLFGSGTATAHFGAVPNGDGQGNTLFDGLDLTYHFEPVAATPEPASLALLGTGVLGIAARRRRRAP
jgi:hypothetical protein